MLPPEVFANKAALPIAVFAPPFVLLNNALYPNALFADAKVLLLPAVKPKNVFSLVESIFAASLLFTLKVNGTSSVVPIKLVPSTVPEFPVNDQPLAAPADCHVPTPLASEVNILPMPCVPSTMRMAPLVDFTICNFVDGPAIPIPTFTLDVSPKI